jgi:hypothetical protein
MFLGKKMFVKKYQKLCGSLRTPGLMGHQQRQAGSLGGSTPALPNAATKKIQLVAALRLGATVVRHFFVEGSNYRLQRGYN